MFPLPVQVVPSGELATVLPPPDPTATHNEPFHAKPRHSEVNVDAPCPLQLIPFLDSAIVLVPTAPANQ